MQMEVSAAGPLATGPAWELTLFDVAPLQLLVKAVSSVLEKNVCFRVVEEEGVFFLGVDGHDPGFSCCLSARLQLDNARFAEGCSPDSSRFCVDPKHMLIALDGSSNATGHVKIQALSNEAVIRVILFDPERLSCQEVSELVTFVHGDDEELREFDFSFCVQLDLVKLKELLRKARDSKAERLSVTVKMKKYGATERSRIQLSVKGEMLSLQRFSHEVTRTEDGSLYVRADDDGKDDVNDQEAWETRFDESFPLAKIDAFVRYLPNVVITSNIGPSLPLLISHRLGGAHELSHLRFFVAPLVESMD